MVVLRGFRFVRGLFYFLRPAISAFNLFYLFTKRTVLLLLPFLFRYSFRSLVRRIILRDFIPQPYI